MLFHLTTSGASTVHPRSNLIAEPYWVMKRAIQYCFEFFLAILLELIAIACKKIALSSKFDLCESLRSRRGLSSAVCHWSLSSVVFVF